MGDIISLGLWIKRRRKALDLTQDALAALVGCSLALIQKIEADARRPSPEIAARLADKLELVADERASFIQAARAELGADRLAPPAQSVARGAFVPAQALSSAADSPGQRRTARPNNLPTPPTPLIGREAELAQIAGRLEQRGCRLRTLVGPGGIGKTRLALQAAIDLSGSFPDGVYFVPLAALSSAALLVPAIAGAVGFIFQGPADPKDQLIGYLREKNLLLVLDNFEQLLAGANVLSDLVQAAPGVVLLATSWALTSLGNLAMVQDDNARAYVLIEESLALYQELRYQWGIAASLGKLGQIAHRQGDDARAAALFDDSLARFHELEDQAGIATLLCLMGEMIHSQGDNLQAAPLLQQSLELFRELENKGEIPWALGHLARVVHTQGDDRRATGLFQECLELAREQGDKPEIAGCLEGLAAIAALRDQPIRATHLFAAGARLRETIGGQLHRRPIDDAECERTLGITRAQLDTATFAATWSQGQALTLEQAIAEALRAAE